MDLGQLIISTSGQGTDGPNVLVARSEGVDDTLTEQLQQWAPRRNELEFGQRQAVCFFKPDQEWLAVSRSAIGPMDSSLQRQVVTRVALVRPADLEHFENNTVLLLHYLRSSGRLMVNDYRGPKLPTISLENQSLAGLMTQPRRQQELNAALKSLRMHRQVALMGIKQPFFFLGCMLNDMSVGERLDVTFSIGLRANHARPFRVQLFHEHDLDLACEAREQQIRVVTAQDLMKKNRRIGV